MLTLGGLASPDTLGPEHGNYLPQRIVLCGLVALAIVVDIDLGDGPAGSPPRAWPAAVGAPIGDRLGLCRATPTARAGEIIRARDAVGRGRRVVFLPAAVRSRFRANPLMHVDNWLGVGTDNIIWGNYETRTITSRSSSGPASTGRRRMSWRTSAARRARRCRPARPRLGAAPRPPRRRDRRARGLQERSLPRRRSPSGSSARSSAGATSGSSCRDRAPHLARKRDGLATMDRIDR